MGSPGELAMRDQLIIVELLADASPKFSAEVKRLIDTKIKSIICSTLKLPELRRLQEASPNHVFENYIFAMLTEAELRRLLRRIDPHYLASGSGRSALMERLSALLSGQTPTPKPQKKTIKKSAQKRYLTFSEAVRISDANQRERALSNLTVSDLRKGIKNEDVHAVALPGKARKAALIHHVQRAIAMGWPGPLDILAG